MSPAAATAAGIHHIPLPTPYAVGDVNTYLIEDDPLVLVDCGPNWATALGALEVRLGERGHGLGDLGLLLLTHHHPDHLGLAGEIHRRAGVEVACLDLMAPVVEDFEKAAAQNDEDVHHGMLRHGVDPAVADALYAESGSNRGWGCSVPVARPLADGAELRLRDRSLTVLHRPGHSAADTVFHDPASGVLLAGDHLLAAISSNAIVSRPLGPWDGRRPRSLLVYRESLRATRELEVSVVLGGHGKPITEHRELIDARLREQEERAAKIGELLTPEGSSAHEIAGGLFGEDVAVRQPFATLSDVLGHLDLLLDDGRAIEDRDAEVIVFRSA